MSDMPKTVEIHEEGPREGFQIEPGPIGSADKVRLIEALAQTGLRDIQVCSFVNPRLVPGWADADEVVRAAKPRDGVDYTALWFNDKGLERALSCGDKLKLSGAISLSASEAFTRKNLHRSHAENLDAMRKQIALHLARGVPVTRIGVMAAFGCNFQGDISPDCTSGEVMGQLPSARNVRARCGSCAGSVDRSSSRSSCSRSRSRDESCAPGGVSSRSGSRTTCATRTRRRDAPSCRCSRAAARR